jgi:hypothetical protein
VYDVVKVEYSFPKIVNCHIAKADKEKLKDEAIDFLSSRRISMKDIKSNRIVSYDQIHLEDESGIDAEYQSCVPSHYKDVVTCTAISLISGWFPDSDLGECIVDQYHVSDALFNINKGDSYIDLCGTDECGGSQASLSTTINEIMSCCMTDSESNSASQETLRCRNLRAISEPGILTKSCIERGMSIFGKNKIRQNMNTIKGAKIDSCLVKTLASGCYPDSDDGACILDPIPLQDNSDSRLPESSRKLRKDLTSLSVCKFKSTSDNQSNLIGEIKTEFPSCTSLDNTIQQSIHTEAISKGISALGGNVTSDNSLSVFSTFSELSNDNFSEQQSFTAPETEDEVSDTDSESYCNYEDITIDICDAKSSEHCGPPIKLNFTVNMYRSVMPSTLSFEITVSSNNDTSCSVRNSDSDTVLESKESNFLKQTSFPYHAPVDGDNPSINKLSILSSLDEEISEMEDYPLDQYDYDSNFKRDITPKDTLPSPINFPNKDNEMIFLDPEGSLHTQDFNIMPMLQIKECTFTPLLHSDDDDSIPFSCCSIQKGKINGDSVQAPKSSDFNSLQLSQSSDDDSVDMSESSDYDSVVMSESCGHDSVVMSQPSDYDSIVMPDLSDCDSVQISESSDYDSISVPKSRNCDSIELPHSISCFVKQSRPVKAQAFDPPRTIDYLAVHMLNLLGDENTSSQLIDCSSLIQVPSIVDNVNEVDNMNPSKYPEDFNAGANLNLVEFHDLPNNNLYNPNKVRQNGENSWQEVSKELAPSMRATQGISLVMTMMIMSMIWGMTIPHWILRVTLA